MMKRICVFCGSNPGVKPSYAEAAKAMGELLAHQSMELVYGGGHVGLMGIVADGVLNAGGRVIGVIPRALEQRELAHKGVQDLRVVESMHERKALMAELSDGFIAMPGGFGTFEEFCEILTWGQLGMHQKPCGLLNIEGYYSALLNLFDHAVIEGFVKPAHRSWVLEDEEPEQLLAKMEAFIPPKTQKWITKQET